MQIATELYKKRMELDMLSTDEYKEYIKYLPQYYHITPKDLDNMRSGLEEGDLINGHLSKK